MLLIWAAERCVKNPTNNGIIAAINLNQLPYFMFSNLLTGIVNLSMNTIFINDFYALFVIVCYQIIACGLMWILNMKKIKIKQW